jgi:hypothetical protein
MSAPHPKEAHMPKPTSRQLTYLKALANQRGVTFSYPKTSADASKEINRLKRLRPESHADRRREREELADAIQAGPTNDAARVRDDEITGQGSHAQWAHTHGPQSTTESNRRESAPPPQVGERTELGSYVINDQARVIIGQRVNGVVRVSDCSAAPGGRAYLIERGLESKTELDALVADYLSQARALGTVPMSVMPIEATG